MRLGVLDVGSNTVHLLVVDAHPGARPLPAAKVKSELQLASLIDRAGDLSRRGADQLVKAISEARAAAEDLGVEDLVAFATSAVRDARNVDDVLSRVRSEANVDLQVLPGEDEARLTFLAVRRWLGWSAGRIVVLDIGGGSLEIAVGIDEAPDAAASIALGAGRLTREFVSNDPPEEGELKNLRRFVRREFAKCARELLLAGEPDHAVATSKTFRALGRISGVAPYSAGPYVRRTMTRTAVSGVLNKISRMPAAERAKLPGVSASRAGQLLAGAVVAEASMELLHIDSVELCPWALREGVILRRLDWLSQN
jgi:exopolyphosphatase/guanosine-5'-triphosphate,3'-diphosphate pyrophosphatase